MKIPTSWFVLSTILALVACSDDETGATGQGGGATTTTTTTSATTGTGGQSGSCDAMGTCSDCQSCVYNEGGACESVLGVCIANEDCVALNQCLTDCVGDDPTLFQGCLAECENDHPQGADDYGDVLACVENACPTSCNF